MAGGSKSTGSSSRKILLRRIESSNLGLSDPDAVVHNLRSLYPDYARLKLLPFASNVRSLLSSTSSHPEEENKDKKKKKKKRPRHDADGGDRNEEGSSLLDDDDAIFEAPVEPQFDVTKSMLRDHYLNKRRLEKKENEDNKREPILVEVESVVERPPRRKGILNYGDDRSIREEQRAKEGVESGGHDLGTVKDGSGPLFKDFGGIDRVIDELLFKVIFPLCHPELLGRLNVGTTAGILLHGPPGCGKTMLAEAIANESKVPLYKISATELVSGVSGESESNVRELFRKAQRTVPSIVFIDEIDAIASKRENMQRDMEKRIVTQLMTCMDESTQLLASIDIKKPGYVLVIGATNRVDSLDPALRRPGRFDREISLQAPDENERKEILKVLTSKLAVEGTLDLSKIARATAGFAGADLKALVNEAGNLAMTRSWNKKMAQFTIEGDKEKNRKWGNLYATCDEFKDFCRQPWCDEEIQDLCIMISDFEEAAKLIQPSLRREGFSSIPDVKWDDIGGLHFLRKKFDLCIVQRIKDPDAYEELGMMSKTGFLLYGPPGCGKTLIAKAVAHEAGANFIYIKGPELLNKYVGESELAVRTIFTRARKCSPCILFFDEVDALATKRGKEGGWVVERLLNQLLIELDGADERHGVHVIGATNRLEVVDPAILRPGRLGKVIYVPLPGADERVLILKALVRKKPLDADVDLDAIGKSESCKNFSGADLAQLVEEASEIALEERIEARRLNAVVSSTICINSSHFEQALKLVSPSVREEDRKYYEAFSRNFQRF